MIKSLVVCAAALSIFGTGIALAQPPATPVPNAAPDFSSFNFLLGTWHCDQSVIGRPGDRKETDTYTMGYDGWQMIDHMVSPPFDKLRSRDVVGDSFMTYDARLKLWVSQNVDNFGGYGLSTSPGWVGNTMTSTGTNPDGTAFKAVTTKMSDTRYAFKVWGNTKKDGQMMVQSTGACTKS